MIKLKVTNRDLKDSICYSFGYCNIEGLVSWKTANGYKMGTYGHDYDAYFHETMNLAITTGYRPYGLSLHDDVYIPEKRKCLTQLLSDYAYTTHDNAEKAKLLEMLFRWCMLDFNVYHAKWLKEGIKEEKNPDGFHHEAMECYKDSIAEIIDKIKAMANI